MNETYFKTRLLIYFVGVLLAAVCISALWTYLGSSMGWHWNKFFRLFAFAVGSYSLAAVLITALVHNRARRFHATTLTAVCGSVMLFASSYAINALPHFWRFWPETKVSDYVWNEIQDVGIGLVFHLVINSLLALWAFENVRWVASKLNMATSSLE